MNQDIEAMPYSGVPEIETAVIREAASFGRQLGILSDAVLELIRHLDRENGSHLLGPTAAQAPRMETGALTDIGKLQALTEQIERIKTAQKDALERDAERALERLKKADPDRYAVLVKSAQA